MWILTRLLRLFPKAFREQFGEDMAEQVGEDWRRARARGGLAGLGFGLATGANLVREALAERVNPTWVAPSTGRTGRMEYPMSGTWKDVKHAVRGLRRSPGFAVISVGTLGLAIGATAGIFSVVETVLLDPLPYPDADRLVYIGASAPGSDLPEEFGVGAEFLLHYGERSALLEDVAGYNSFTNTLRVGDRVERPRMSAPTMTLFNTLGVAPVLGRLPVPEDEDRVVMISHFLWETWFGSDPAVIGQTVYAGGDDRTVIGVMPEDFAFPSDDVVLWIPNPVRAEGLVPGRLGIPLVARVAPGVEQDALVRELQALALELPERFGGTAEYARLMQLHRPVVRPLKEELVGDVTRPLWVLLGSVGIVLLIACANVANLFMVRGENRQRDLAVRRAIGAGRGRLFRSQMAESLVVAVLAGGLAVVLAWVSVPAFLRAAPPSIPRLADVRVTGSTLLFTLGVSLFAALLCGLVPALRAASPDLLRLRDGSRGSTRRRHWGRDGLVVAQTALALVLLIGSGLLVRSFQHLRNVDAGYETDDLFTFQIAPEQIHLTDGPSFARFHMDFMERLRGLPGVETVGIVENVPLDEGVQSTRFQTAGSADGPDSGPLLGVTFTGGDYFEAMGIELVAGRAFSDADHISEPNNIIISESAARLLWPGEDPIGQRVRRPGLEPWQTVVGVVEDIMQSGFRDEVQPLVYFPLAGPEPMSWGLSSPGYVLKTSRADFIAPDVRALVSEIAPEAPMYRIFTMAGLAERSMVQLSFTMLTLGVTSVLALILGTVGLYGVLSYVVAERTREIGVRMALGAEASGVRRMVVAQGARVVLLGVGIGVLVALASTPALGSLLFNVGAIDATTFVAMSTAMLAVGLLASYVPARRASSVDPIRSLREG